MPLDVTPNDPSLADQLPAEAYYHLIRTLRLTLPPPPGGSPEDFRRRDHAAIAAVAALAPANAAEAKLAAQFVGASEQWTDCLRLAQLPETTPEWAAKCRAQALSMMRQANSALRLLLGTQQARQKLEADNVACNRLAWTEHVAIGLMAEALEYPQPSEAKPSEAPVKAGARIESGASEAPAKRVPICEQIGVPSGAQPPAPPHTGLEATSPAAEPAAAPTHPGAETTSPLPAREGPGEGFSFAAGLRSTPPLDPLPQRKGKLRSRGSGEGSEPAAAAETPDSLAEAEHYAILYPERAALIRRMGGLPDDLSFGPPDDDIVAALISGRSPALAALDGLAIPPGAIRGNSRLDQASAA